MTGRPVWAAMRSVLAAGSQMTEGAALSCIPAWGQTVEWTPPLRGLALTVDIWILLIVPPLLRSNGSYCCERTSSECVDNMADSESMNARRPGPRRPDGAPVGADEVRRAVLDAAATLFAVYGVGQVSLRDVAAAADTHLALISRYIGNREQLELAVFDDLSEQLARSVSEHPLEGQGHGNDTVMGKWSRVAASLAIKGRPLAGRPGFNPVKAMADTLADAYGLEPVAARVRAAQIVATAIGWRVFEDYLIAAGELDEIPLATLREELVHSGRRLGATPWPSQPDPEPRRG